jgi:hypothetical protein
MLKGNVRRDTNRPLLLSSIFSIIPPFPGNYTKEKAKEIIKRRIQKK